MRQRFAVVIPSFGKAGLTASVVLTALLELPPSKVVVVDNGGDYRPVAEETVLHPDENLGWLRGCNAGMEHAFEQNEDLEGVILLNNDVTVSDGFFSGLIEAAESTSDAGLVAPCYDDDFKSQHRYWSGSAAEFPARPVEHSVQLVDGTALLVTRSARALVGGLDEEHFGRYGWGSEADYCARVRAAGLRVVVTERSYLEHAGGTTAKAHDKGYEQAAYAEMASGLALLYGPRWRRDLGFPRDGSGRGGLLGLPYFALRRLRLLLGFHR